MTRTATPIFVLVFIVLIIFCSLIGTLVYGVTVFTRWTESNQTPPAHEVNTVISIASSARLPSPLGTVPPSRVIDESDRHNYDVRLPHFTPPSFDRQTFETRMMPDGSFFTHMGEGLILAQKKAETGASPWTLHIPAWVEGEIRLTAGIIGDSPSQIVQVPDRFTRIEWYEGAWLFILVDAEGQQPVSVLDAVARSVQ